MPEHIIPFPYLNSFSVQFIPYVPVFLGDFYPIKRPENSGRRPWTVYKEFLAKVRLARNTRVWFMPQGFGTGDIYALPTAGEIRLMLNLAVAAGVKGICWHGTANGTWPWMKNYWAYRYSLLGAGGQRTDSWEGVRDCARELAAVGALIVRSTPGTVPENIRLECGIYRDPKDFYNGPAVKAFSLKTPGGLLLSIINQNPVSQEKALVKGLPEHVFDLGDFMPLNTNEVSLKLAPGGVHYFYIGNSTEEIDLCCRQRFQREKVRYQLEAERAAANGIQISSPDKLDRLPPPKALHALFNEQKKLQKRIQNAPLGLALNEMAESRQILEKIDFTLTTWLDLVVTPEMRKKAEKYGRIGDHPNPEINEIRKIFSRNFADFFRLSDALDNQSKAENLLKEIQQLNSRIKKDYKHAMLILTKYKSEFTPDNPYQKNE